MDQAWVLKYSYTCFYSNHSTTNHKRLMCVLFHVVQGGVRGRMSGICASTEYMYINGRVMLHMHIV